MASPSTSTLPTTTLTNGAPQESFISNFDLDNPVEAISSYSKLLHAHTKAQLELSNRQANRRSDKSGVSAMSHMSNDGSVDSVDSLEQS